MTVWMNTRRKSGSIVLFSFSLKFGSFRTMKKLHIQTMFYQMNIPAGIHRRTITRQTVMVVNELYFYIHMYTFIYKDMLYLIIFYVLSLKDKLLYPFLEDSSCCCRRRSNVIWSRYHCIMLLVYISFIYYIQLHIVQMYTQHSIIINILSLI